MRIHKGLLVAFFVAALVGFADASYLTAEHVRGVVPPCSVLTNCERVLTSSYAVVAGVPVSAVGLLYYGSLLVLLIAYVDSHNRRVLHVACWVISAGMLGTLYFLYVQGFVLGAWCPYCLVSAATTTTLFGMAVYVMRLD